jgi:hypothetical protein
MITCNCETVHDVLEENATSVFWPDLKESPLLLKFVGLNYVSWGLAKPRSSAFLFFQLNLGGLMIVYDCLPIT